MLKRWLVVFGAASLPLLAARAAEFFYPWLAKPTREGVLWLLHVVGLPASRAGNDARPAVTITDFVRHCVDARSIGMTGVSIFLGLLLLFVFVRRESISPRKLFVAVPLGIAVMLLLNIVRFALVVATDWELHLRLSSWRNLPAQMEIASLVIGLVVYGAGLMLFFVSLRRLQAV